MSYRDIEARRLRTVEARTYRKLSRLSYFFGMNPIFLKKSDRVRPKVSKFFPLFSSRFIALSTFDRGKGKGKGNKIRMKKRVVTFHVARSNKNYPETGQISMGHAKNRIGKRENMREKKDERQGRGELFFLEMQIH